MMGWKARRKMKGRGRISICVANDLLTRDLMHTHRCLWWRMVTGNPGLGGNYKCFVTLCPSVLWAEWRCNLLLILIPLLLCSLREWFITIFLSVQKPCLTSHPVFCIRRGGKLLGCGYAEINQNILTNILTGSWSAWLFGTLSDSRRMSFRTDMKFSSLDTCIVERELGPSACMGGFWVKVELNAQTLSIFGVLHELDSHARAHCTVCVCC